MASTTDTLIRTQRSRVLEGDEGLPSCGEVGYFDYFSFRWVSPLLSTGAERQIDLEDTPTLAEAEDTLSNTQKVLARLEAAERAGSSQPLLRAVVLVFWRELLLIEVLRAIQHGLTILKPLAMQKVLAFQEAQNSAAQNGLDVPSGVASRGITAIGIMIALNLFEIFFNAHVDFYYQRLILRIGSALRGTVLVRCVQGRSADGGGKGKAAPMVYNVLSFDVPPSVDLIWVLLGMALFPFQFSASLAVLFTQVKSAAYPGLFTIIVAKVIVGVLLFCDGLYRDLHLRAKDVRLSGCNEGFNHIRTLQMLSWVGPCQDRIMVARREELHYRARRLWMSKMGAALDYSLSTIVTLVTFAYFMSVSNGQLKASVALPVIALITSLIGPFANFPTWLNQYVIWRSAYGRVCSFLGLGGAPPPEGAAAGAPGGPPDGPPAAFHDCTLSWGSRTDAGENDEERDAEAAEEKEPLLKAEAFTLKDLDLEVGGGELLVLVSLEGQGKSSVLQGLLGEMVVEAGSLRSPALARPTLAAGASLPPTSRKARALLAGSRGGSMRLSAHAVPYAAQEVLLVTGSVRWNVLFGAKEEDALYERTLAACQLEADLAVLPAGDLTEVAQGGANLSGGQKARVGLARAVYRAALLAREQPGAAPLVLLDDVLCALDRRVAREVCEQLFRPPEGLLVNCAVVLATADPWFLGCLGASARVAVLRGGRAVALGRAEDLCGQGLVELRAALPPAPPGGGGGGAGPGSAGGGAPAPGAAEVQTSNPQDALEEPPPGPPATAAPAAAPPQPTATKLAGPPDAPEPAGEGDPEVLKDAGVVVKDEEREKGQVKCATYLAYLESVGPLMLLIIAIALTGIMVFQNACNLWIVYWTSEHRETTKFYKWLSKFTDTPPSNSGQLLLVYAIFVVCFTFCNFAGHALEILGGVGAARKIFNEALCGSLARPFRWWDANPTGRVLNRFSEDVEVMDAAITNILGVIFGAVLYFVSHTIVLAIANPFSLILLPIVIIVLEFYARYYRRTVREVQRIYLVSMGTVYQEMVESILGKVTVRAYDATQQFLCSSLERLERYQRNSFTKTCVQAWVKLRMGLIGYCLGLYNTLQPLLQYVGLVHGQSAALVGFSINYSHDIMAIVQQLIMNYSDLEMQLVSIERLMEYAEVEEQASRPATLPPTALGLRLEGVEVCYRQGLPPALSGVSLDFPPREAVAIVGRTGAGKSSLLLSVLQLVPYTGRMTIGGHSLAGLDPQDVRRRLVGVVPQHPVVFSGDLRWNLDPEGKHGEAELLEALRAVGLQAACVGGTEALGRPPAGLSAGQRQLLCAARCLLRRPRVALLDEVTASLPPEVAESTVNALIRRFKELNAAVLLVTHQEELLSSCERVVTVARGRVVADARAPG